MHIKFSLLTLFLLLTPICFSEYDRTWVQLGSGFGASHLQVKTASENSGWAFEISGYSRPALFDGTIIDRKTNKEVDPMFRVLAISKLWGSPFNWGYADYGLGLGVGSGSWTKNCEKEDDFLGGTYECDYYQGTKVGIPLQASIALGKYVGLGISLTAFIHPENPQIRMLFTLPLGNFTR